MKILLLADVTSAHTQKWVEALDAVPNLELGLFTLTQPVENGYTTRLQKTTVFSALSFAGTGLFLGGLLPKIQYLKVIPYLKKTIKTFNPDLIHAHYATSYGLLGALSGKHPFMLSVWGSDIYDFPNEGFLNRYIIKYNLKNADVIGSTSFVMKKETEKYVQNKPIYVTPFGIDSSVFLPKKALNLGNSELKTIGIVKRMDDKYGIDYLIRGFAMVLKAYNAAPLRLLLVGGGIKEESYKKLATDLGIAQHVVFQGLVPFNEVPDWHNELDIYVSPSVLDSESFGVSAVEAMACERPVIVANVGGLPEVVLENETGIVIPPRNAAAIAEAILHILENPEQAINMGKQGRKHVQKNYEWRNNVKTMLDVYESYRYFLQTK